MVAVETAKPFASTVIATSQEYRDRYAPTQPDMIHASCGATDLLVQNSGNTAVTVNNGGAIVQAGRYDLTGGPLSLSVAANGGGSNRFDVVCLTYDAGHSPPIYARIVQGTAGAGLPAMTNNPSGIWDFPLSQYEKQPGGNIVNMVDRRKFTDGKGGIVGAFNSGFPLAPFVGMELLTQPNSIKWAWDGANWFVRDFGPPVLITKTADTARTNTGVLAADPHLTWTPFTNSIYKIEMFIIHDSGNTAVDIQFDFTVPAGAFFNWVPLSLSPTDADQNTAQQAGMLRMGFTNGSTSRTVGSHSTMTVAAITGYLSMGATSGAFTMRWAQGAPAAGITTTVRNGSFFTAERKTG